MVNIVWQICLSIIVVAGTIAGMFLFILAMMGLVTAIVWSAKSIWSWIKAGCPGMEYEKPV